jgi:hypothetical protein
MYGRAIAAPIITPIPNTKQIMLVSKVIFISAISSTFP